MQFLCPISCKTVRLSWFSGYLCTCITCISSNITYFILVVIIFSLKVIFSVSPPDSSVETDRGIKTKFTVEMQAGGIFAFPDIPFIFWSSQTGFITMLIVKFTVFFHRYAILGVISFHYIKCRGKQLRYPHLWGFFRRNLTTSISLYSVNKMILHRSPYSFLIPFGDHYSTEIILLF